MFDLCKLGVESGKQWKAGLSMAAQCWALDINILSGALSRSNGFAEERLQREPARAIDVMITRERHQSIQLLQGPGTVYFAQDGRFDCSLYSGLQASRGDCDH